jgi:hypothetical protein
MDGRDKPGHHGVDWLSLRPAMTNRYYSVQSEFAVDGLELGRLDQLAMGHAH